MTPRKSNPAASDTASEKIRRLNVRISGSGGQGIISMGILLGEAIAIGDGKNVSQSQSYGPEARGGTTRADIIISDSEIYFPECNQLDLLVAFTYEAYEEYAVQVKPEGLVIADKGAVDVLVGSAKTIQVPFIEIAEKKFQRPLAANMIALGFIAAYTKMVSRHSLRKVIMEQFAGSKHADLNQKALEEGFNQGVNFKPEDIIR